MLKVGYYRTEIYLKVQVFRIDGIKLRAYELSNKIAYANKQLRILLFAKYQHKIYYCPDGKCNEQKKYFNVHRCNERTE